jgi:hypothetical protein
MVKNMSERVETFSEIIKVLAGKGSDLVLSFEDLTLTVVRGESEKPQFGLKFSGSIRLDVVYVKE